jgi:hypothetical protein
MEARSRAGPCVDKAVEILNDFSCGSLRRHRLQTYLVKSCIILVRVSPVALMLLRAKLCGLGDQHRTLLRHGATVRFERIPGIKHARRCRSGQDSDCVRHREP